ncbi:cytochrome bc complex cytochrome b subunit [Actinomadura sp. ATCC 31491]|uniref:Cytochrome bc1 complex cytochrome b subunit n=1 Tax=Actinomadura luzonensis TaxID=2805427 RepID=A0ABT0G3H7_9ACTN|nr:cytochrome bc complex cytochrome b subunit [Actinomadura luzonensis]MCK2218745.1 cytochrome bc complex cytochrome b subunit [Actinomadura luzonensis]
MQTGPRTVPGAVARTSSFLDERLGAAPLVNRNLRKIFPDHWSFLLGEIALYSFVILLLTGTFLTFWFKPSMGEVVYDGVYAPLRGVAMSQAYASTLELSFEVRGGLLLRQMHHWSALLFIGGMMIHALRVFFTGAYRKPRELTWLIGVTMLAIALLEGLTGYSLPDDLLSGAGLRVTEGVLISLPLVGTYLTFLLFGGEYPGEDVVSRFYSLHILLIPGVLLALVSVHLVLMWVQKHTQMPGRSRTDANVVGAPLFPSFAAKTAAFFLFTLGTVTGLASLTQINPVWLYGPYSPADISAGSQPDFYLGFLEGALRLMPAWELNLLGSAHAGTIPLSVVVPALVPLGLVLTGMALYPFLERWLTGDHREHHVLERPRDHPHRTAIGMSVVVFYGVLWLLGANDELASTFHVSLNAITYAGRVLVFAGPALAYVVTYRICLGLQRADAELAGHGVPTGVIRRLPHGAFTEAHAPLDEEAAARLRAKRPVPALPAARAAGGGAVPPDGLRRPLGRLRARMSAAYGGEKVPLDGDAGHDRSLTR